MEMSHLPEMKNPKRLARWTTRRFLNRVPLEWLCRLAPREVLALFYHVVSDSDLDHLRYYRFKTSEQFRKDLEWLAARFGFISYDELQAALRNGHVSKRNSVLLTFDDGLAECYSVVAPLLKQVDANGIFFVSTGYIGDTQIFRESRVSLCLSRLNVAPLEQLESLEELLRSYILSASMENRAQARLKRSRQTNLSSGLRRDLVAKMLMLPDCETLDKACVLLGVCPNEYAASQPIFMTESQLKELSEQGFTIGAHSVSHRHFQNLSEKEQEREILESCDRVRQITGKTQIPFAFPYSARGVSNELVSRVRSKNSFVGTFFETGGFRSARPAMVNRIWADLPENGVGPELESLFKKRWFA